jgi:hypothetical protein
MAQTIDLVTLLLSMNTKLFQNALAGLTEEQAQQRISDHNNPAIWIAAHTTSARYTMLQLLGKNVTDPYAALFEQFRAYDPKLKYPTLAETQVEWTTVSAQLTAAMAEVSEETLLADAPFKNPSGDFSIAGTLAFFTHHECYGLGQMAFLKKYFTKEPMKY